MADTKNANLGNNFKEAVCIDAGRVYDSCCDRDCLEDLRCFFSEESQEIINTAISVKLKSARVIDAYIDVEPVNLNRGFYSCDITFFFSVDIDAFTAPYTEPTTLNAIAEFNKKVILFGSEGNVNIFTSDSDAIEKSTVNGNEPKCVVQCVEPVCLSAHLGIPTTITENITNVPEKLLNRVGGNLALEPREVLQTVYITLGLFSIVQLVRNVQMLIPSYDFYLPEKQCVDNADQPCDLFNKIKFPTDDFFPPRSFSENENCGCGSVQ